MDASVAEERGRVVVAPLDSWPREQLEGAARALSVVLVAQRADRASPAYRAAARMLLDVSAALEDAGAARPG